MKRVLVVGEGLHEAGDDPADGALVRLIRRLHEGAAIAADFKRIQDERFARYLGRGNKLARRLLGIVSYAQNSGYDAVVILFDQDEVPNRRISATLAQNDEQFSLPRAIGVAVETFDAWFLADEHAFRKVTGVIVPRQPDPETIKDPKSRISEILSDIGCDIRQRDFYREAAECVDLSQLSARCPLGFAPFAERVLKLPLQI